ncbi:alpha/beta hydrolase [Patescibacteria group bacterium]|nr:alpha/beta hydrolase [Patescibacteria group bacterium]MBU1755265.1 alpha/beta hydrolase [Patescibacteria group bacterium]
MKQQVFVIHGGNAFDTYEEYLSYLQAKEVNLESLQYSDWKHSLQETLGDSYEVIAPRMPNSNNAKYLEWKIYFEKFIPLLQENVIVIGHSLGGIFLAKYFSEEACPTSIRAVFLVAAPFSTASQHPLADFVLSTDLHLLQEQGSEVFLYHSTDDAVVPYSNVEEYVQHLPEAKLRTLEGRNHINQPEFPELVKDIQSVTSESN